MFEATLKNFRKTVKMYNNNIQLIRTEQLQEPNTV